MSSEEGRILARCSSSAFFPRNSPFRVHEMSSLRSETQEIWESRSCSKACCISTLGGLLLPRFGKCQARTNYAKEVSYAKYETPCSCLFCHALMSRVWAGG